MSRKNATKNNRRKQKMGGMFFIRADANSPYNMRTFAIWNFGSVPYEVRNTATTSAKCIGVWRKTQSGEESFSTYCLGGGQESLAPIIREMATKEGLSSAGTHMTVKDASHIVTFSGLIRIERDELVIVHKIHFTPAGGGDV